MTHQHYTRDSTDDFELIYKTNRTFNLSTTIKINLYGSTWWGHYATILHYVNMATTIKLSDF